MFLLFAGMRSARHHHRRLDNAGNFQLCRTLACAGWLLLIQPALERKRAPWTQGLKLTQRLRPVTFNWKKVTRQTRLDRRGSGCRRTIVATHNNKGEIEGVKYVQLNVVLIQRSQRATGQIERQQQQLQQQQDNCGNSKR